MAQQDDKQKQLLTEVMNADAKDGLYETISKKETVQTAVEYLFQKLWDTPKDKLTWYAILKNAKQMEKEQIVNAYNQSWHNRMNPYKTAEKYYNETYGGNNE